MKMERRKGGWLDFSTKISNLSPLKTHTNTIDCFILSLEPVFLFVLLFFQCLF